MTRVVVESLVARPSSGRQSAFYKELLEMKDADYNPETVEVHRLQILIERNTYEFQSSARIERWNGTEWKYVADIPYSEMLTGNIAYKKGVENKDFVGDRRDLIMQAALVLYGQPWEGN